MSNNNSLIRRGIANRLIIRPKSNDDTELRKGSLDFLSFIETEEGVEVVHSAGHSLPLEYISIEIGNNVKFIKAIKKGKIAELMTKPLATTDNYIIVEKN